MMLSNLGGVLKQREPSWGFLKGSPRDSRPESQATKIGVRQRKDRLLRGITRYPSLESFQEKISQNLELYWKLFVTEMISEFIWFFKRFDHQQSLIFWGGWKFPQVLYRPFSVRRDWPTLSMGTRGTGVNGSLSCGCFWVSKCRGFMQRPQSGAGFPLTSLPGISRSTVAAEGGLTLI